ncbi:MAG: hypothetical protein H0V68_03145 [Actinobacteria bacterium]|nr:hypothetical protein [Actinomycetota bacterium]
MHRASSTRRRCSARSRTRSGPVLIPRGQTSAGGQSPLFGVEAFVNHGRNYYNDSKPFLVPYEYTWKPQLIYAPTEFTTGLFNAMRANSSTGDFAKSSNRQYLEGYSASRGGSAAPTRSSRPMRPSASSTARRSRNSRALLGWNDPARGKGAGRNPAYTIYILNTWDSATARAILNPKDEYHVWKVNRTDPDTGDFDGIDWARIWGGRYRFMMVDTGAAR